MLVSSMDDNVRFTVRLGKQMTNIELSEAIQQAFSLRQRTSEDDPFYERISEHLNRLVLVQRIRAETCTVDDSDYKHARL